MVDDMVVLQGGTGGLTPRVQGHGDDQGVVAGRGIDAGLCLAPLKSCHAHDLGSAARIDAIHEDGAAVDLGALSVRVARWDALADGCEVAQSCRYPALDVEAEASASNWPCQRVCLPQDVVASKGGRAVRRPGAAGPADRDGGSRWRCGTAPWQRRRRRSRCRAAHRPGPGSANPAAPGCRLRGLRGTQPPECRRWPCPSPDGPCSVGVCGGSRSCTPVGHPHPEP